MRKIYRASLPILLTLLATTAIAAETDIFQLNLPQIAKRLGWVNKENPNQLCQGYYREKAIHFPHNPNSQLVDWDADSSRINKEGVSEFDGHVVITEYNKQALAERAYLYRDPKTNKAKRFELAGNIQLHEPGQMIYANKANIWLHTNRWLINDALYRVLLNSHNPDLVTKKDQTTKSGGRKIYQLSAWGRSKSIKQQKKKVWDLYDATYTTCSPTCHIWHLEANHIHLNKITGRGYATNAKLYVKGVPVFWFPYINFPLDNRRKSGLLAPRYGSSSSLGAYATFPIYWNMAPNYDMIFTPNYSGKRGLYFQDNFRYLTANSTGSLDTTYAPNDNEFSTLKRKMNKRYAGKAAQAKQLRELNNKSNQRDFIHWKNNTQFNQHLFLNVDYSRASDNYYVEDFGNTDSDTGNANQLLQQAMFNYYGNLWQVTANFQRYQTLHPLDQANLDNQYAKLPEVQYYGTSALHPYGLVFSLGSDFTNFNKNRNPFNYNLDSPTTGDRFNLDPTVSLPLSNSYFFFTPRAQMEMTAYRLNRPNPGAKSAPASTIPIIDVHTGMYFDTVTKLFGKNYTQTLEPELYYLYVPYRNQDRLPLFNTVNDSAPTSFDYNQLFVDNRFGDIDRIGDANQITYAVTTRFRDINTGQQKLSMSLGQIYYFKNRKVGACTKTNTNNPYTQTCPSTLSSFDKQTTSPVVGQMTYNINNFWSLSGNLAYNLETKKMENQSISFNFKQDQKHILNIAYTYARDGNVDPTAPADSSRNNLQQINLSASWPINIAWQTLGQWNYSLSHHNIQSYLYGIEYDSCCWALRAAVSRTFTGLNPDNKNQYDNRFFIQFALKGFTKLGSHDPESYLQNNITNYQDYFGEDY